MLAYFKFVSNFAHASTHAEYAVNGLILCVLIFAHRAVNCVKLRRKLLQQFNKLLHLGIK